MIYYILRALFHVLLIRPFMYVWVGFNVKHGGRLPQNGPAIIVSNHNSHLDTLTLEILFPLRFLRKIRPVAAADYFLRNRILKWFTVDVMRIIPVERRGKGGADPLAPCHEALARGHVLIIYPEGSRGEPGKMAEFKRGISWLATQHPEVPIYPICLRGLEKILPKGSWLPIPFFCDVAVGEPMFGTGNREDFLHQLEKRMHDLAEEIKVEHWI